MPVILNIETSTDVCSVALTCDGQVVFNKENHESMSHASSLGGYVQDAVSVAKSHHFAIDAVAGPVLIPVCVLVFPRRRGFVSVSMSLSLPLIRWQ